MSKHKKARLQSDSHQKYLLNYNTLEVILTEALLTLGVFAVPILAVAVIEQRKMELEHRKRELALMRETEQLIQFKHGMAYRDECMKQRVLNTERQQVDKETARYEG